MRAPLPAELQAAALRWQAQGMAAVVVQVGAKRGSVPRDPGARMLVAADVVLGTIGGGHLELAAIAQAREMLAQGVSQAVTRRVALGASLGQCCGGVLELTHTPLAQARPDAWVLPAPRMRLQLHGAGHVGQAVVRLLEAIPCGVCWIDQREDAFPAASLPPHIQKLCSDDPPAEAAAAESGTGFLVMTHSHALDQAICEAVLRRADGAWLGLIGSRSKRLRFERRLAERGLPPERVSRLVCPVGLPGVVGKEPGVIAVAVVAQLLQSLPISMSCGGSGAASVS